MKHILYIKLDNSSFFKIDEEILKRHFLVKTMLFKSTPRHSFVLSLFRLLWMLMRNVFWADGVFIRFADHYAAIIALFANIFRKKLFIVIGGYDATHLPELNYGVWNSWWRGRCARYAIKHADCLLPNNPTMIRNVNKFAYKKPIKAGIKHFVPETNARIRVVYNGYKPEAWGKKDVVRKKNSVITVASVSNKRTFKLKGLDSFVRLADEMPETEFTIVGLKEGFLEDNGIKKPDNLIVYPKTPHSKLSELYQKSKVFCLLSLSEGMPNVLCEAMLSECIPVGSAVNAIPEIIDDTGFVIEENTITAMKRQVQKALAADAVLGRNARKRIEENYPIKRRDDELTEIIEEVLEE